MSDTKRCFFNQERPCDLTCKAAFEVDDPVDNVDCYFIWLAHNFGESLFSLRTLIESPGGPFGGAAGGEGSGPGPAPKPPKGFPNN